MSLLDASPPVEAYRARPYDVSQLDTHPDAARLWATVVALREECSSVAVFWIMRVAGQFDQQFHGFYGVEIALCSARAFYELDASSGG